MIMATPLIPLLNDVLAGHRLTPEEGEILMKTTGRDVFRITAAADEMREKKVGDIVTYVRNQNLHVTNICKNLCGFCGFGKKATDPGAYCLDRDTIQAGVRLAQERNVTEICFLSGVNPAFDLDSLYRADHRGARDRPGDPCPRLQPGRGCPCGKEKQATTAEVLAALRDAGLGSLQGTAAEILIEPVRKVICPRKVSGAEWVRIIREAHEMGIRTSATIMYGSVRVSPRPSGPYGRLSGRSRTRPVGLPSSSRCPISTPIPRSSPQGLPGPGNRPEDILMIAVSRLFLDNFNNVQVSWGKLGLKMTQLALMCGGNDLAGTMFTDEVSVDAGAGDASYLAPAVMERMTADLGRTLRERTTLYDVV